ncbi:MAG: HAMP domain-containing histidine kinase, partial [Cyclobacteriaceae bacterium]|nr:HAMP domain-containing histidine kinase [Cyclobacteriaceae bacterium]
YMLLGLYRKNQMDDDEFKQLVPELYKNVGAILEVLNNLLRWSMGEMKMIKSEPCPIILHEKAIEMLNFFSTLSQQKMLQIQNLIPEDLAVMLDPNQLELILRNLINNAIKFSNKGGRITLSTKEQEDMVTVAIQDEGLGMSQEEVGKLFQNTLADSKRGTTGEQGTGLGLNLCQLYIEKSGGKIWVESEPGKGSIFYFSVKKASVNSELVH